MERPQIKAPGLKVKQTKTRLYLYWTPSPAAIEQGYPSGPVNLTSLWDGTQIGAEEVTRRCAYLQTEMRLWLDGQRKERGAFDGTLLSVMNVYECHPDSPFHRLKPNTQHPYLVYLRRLREHVGPRLVKAVSAYDVRQWHKVWGEADEHGRLTKPGAATMALAVLTSAVKWGAELRHDDCRRLYDDIRLLRLPKPKPRAQVFTAQQVTAAREAAHRRGFPSRALAYAIQFECALRAYDVIGQWHRLNAPLLGELVGPYGKWAGLCWRHIDKDMVLRVTPTKTEGSTGLSIAVDLKLCPMVLEEIARVPPEARTGPLIVNERTRRPYRADQFLRGWRKDFANAGLPGELWARDLRASAVTEARRGGAATDDAAKVAGHASARTTAEVYDRDRLDAHRRVAEARKKVRQGE